MLYIVFERCINTGSVQVHTCTMYLVTMIHIIKDEEMEIGEVFAMIGNLVIEDDEALEKSQVKVKTTISTNQDNIEPNIHGVKIEVLNEETPKVEVQNFEYTINHSLRKRGEEKTKFDQLFWARATIATRMGTKVLNDGSQ